MGVSVLLLITIKELPEDPNLMPPISFQLFTKPKFKRNPIPIGICASQTADHFLVPVISETKQNLLKNELPIHSSNQTFIQSFYYIFYHFEI